MKAVVLRIAYALGFIAASCIGGWYLGAFISRSSLWMPQWLWDAVAAAVKASGITSLYDEDEVESLCLTCLFIACWASVALVLGVVWILIARYMQRRRSK